MEILRVDAGKARWPAKAAPCYAAAWRQLWPNFLPLAGITILGGLMLLPAAIPFVGWIFALLIAPPVYCGVSYCQHRAVRGEKFVIRDLFIGFHNFNACLGVGMLAAGYLGVVFVLGMMTLLVGGVADATFGFGTELLWTLLLIGTLYVSTRIMFFWEFVVEGKMGAIESLKASWHVMDGRMWELAKICLIGAPLGFAGTLILVVGVIPAYTLVSMAQSALLIAAHAEDEERPLTPGSINP